MKITVKSYYHLSSSQFNTPAGYSILCRAQVMVFPGFSVCETDAFVLIWRVVLIWLICVELKVLLKYTFYMENINFLNLKLNLKSECIVSTAYFVSQRSKIVQNKLHIHNRKYLKIYLLGLFWSRF